MNNYKQYYAQKKTSLQPLTDTQNFIDNDIPPTPLNLSPEQALRAKIVNESYVEYRAAIEKAKQK